MQAQQIPIDSLLLDPVNYRLQDEPGYNHVSEDKFHLEQVQKNTFNRIKQTGIKELHDSIVANGFLPIERIVVSPYKSDEQKGMFIVIEGNRRVAALKQIKDEVAGGVEIPSNVIETLSEVPCIVFDDQENQAFFKETLMGIRHVGGIKQWGGYQRAKLISDLRDVHNVDAQDVAAKLGMSTREVNRRYRAFKALQQMREDDDFGDLAAPTLYPLFHEAIAVPDVKEWLGWSDEKNQFLKADELHQFYALISPFTPDDSNTERSPKLVTYSDVRQLKHVLPNPEAKRFLLDLERPFLDSLTIANKAELSKKWREELSEAIASLEGIGALEVRNFSGDDVALLKRIEAATQQIMEIHQAVQPK